MNKLIVASLTVSGLLLTPLALANNACSPESPAACKSKLEQDCLYYLIDEVEMEDGFAFYAEDHHRDGYDIGKKETSDFEESDLLLSDLKDLSLTNEQQSLISNWQTYNKQFDKDWMNLCMSHPNKDNSLSDQFNWEEANLKNDLIYIQQSRIFVDKVNASLTETQKQQLVQLGLMQILP